MMPVWALDYGSMREERFNLYIDNVFELRQAITARCIESTNLVFSKDSLTFFSLRL